jgi:hypothetical protein
LTVTFLLDEVEAAYFAVPAKRTWKYHVPFVAGEYVYDQRWVLVVLRVASFTQVLEPGFFA